MTKTNLKGLTLSELEEFALSVGEQRYRGKQLFDWIYTKAAASFHEMTPLSGTLREKLAGLASIDSLELVEEQKSGADGTTKFLFGLADGKKIESVLIPPRTAFRGREATGEEEQKRLTLCVSTQVGCPLDCAFCATATMGFHRNLSAGEIVDQVLQARKHSETRITNLVYMGMGEPLMNYDHVMNSIDIITTGLKIAAKRITVSTAGWVPKIRQMADEGRKVKLAISLHTLDDAARTELMPVNSKFGLDELLDAAAYYYRRVKQRITFEYILFDGWNDREEDIERLIKLSKRLPCKLNIIPFHDIMFTNPTGLAATLHPTPPARIERFVRRLRDAHITVFVRSSAGEDIDAACGQLAVKLEARGRTGRGAAHRARPALKPA
ncbi:MAG TPA: 23S rRNA (adenine(2503)-C(2))-methyltransferase RlmN [Bacteroidota bacterium]|jgi:23S rRNA (adenine2503-C2)-methyltransferase